MRVAFMGWRRVLCAVLIAVMLAGFNSSREASAQTSTYAIIAVPIRGLSGDVACIGEDVVFSVFLYEHFEGKTVQISQMVNIDALNTGGRGTFANNRRAIGSSFMSPASAMFFYTPKSEGPESIYFETNVPPNVSLEEAPIYASSAPIEFTVDDCPYEIEGVYNVNYESPDGRIAFFGLIPLTELKGEELLGKPVYSADTLFLGNFTTWFPSCDLSMTRVKADAEAVAVPEGETLVVTLNYKPTEVTGQASCDFGTGPAAAYPMDFNTLDALTSFRVPINGGTQVVQVNEYATMTMTVSRKRGGD